GRGGLKVQRRRGAQLQVVADPTRARALSRLPGVAGARVASAAFADAAAVSQGVERSGADVLGRVASGGDGVVIAVLDLGFGQNLATQQARGELPPADRLETLSFDAAGGLSGSNAYGNRTNHGELVAQTVFDYAPRARYLLVNYHTESDFLAAVDTLIARRVDIVVHSNSFIEGPFDGTSPTARAVDRAAAAGILWFNSAGNYAQLSWGGEWDDADGDGDLDWPNGDSWTFPRAAGLPITFALSWTSPPGGPATDIDLVLERQDVSGSWTPVMGSSDRQSAGAPPSERITGYSPPADGTFRLRAVLQSGPPPVGPLTLFSREIGLADIGGTAVSSLPTPGDAAGAVSVGAVNWRGDGFKAYSSQGPTDDGRVKPDVVAPTDTRLMGPNGLRSVGGTSIAAPNAAGAAAVLLAAERGAGRFPSAGEVRGQLTGLAVDLGVPGPDTTFGAGRVRVNIDAPRLAAIEPAPLSSVRGRVTVRFKALSRSRVTQWSLRLDGAPAVRRAQTYPRGISVDTRRLPDGWHALSVQAKDFSGNLGGSDWAVQVDNTRPQLVVRAVRLAKVRRAHARAGARASGARREARLIVAAADAGTTGTLATTVDLRTSSGRSVSLRTIRLKPGPLRAISLGRLSPGRYRVRLDLRDRAGNPAVVSRTIRVR
ncbi:MAG: S8 family serine peptidase, partial [Thermoleophilia bacterium]